MVAVQAKPETDRGAVACSTVRLCAEAFSAIAAGTGPKGDAVQVARLAAFSATKRTADLIPLCHPVRITGVEVQVALDAARNTVTFTVQVTARDRTGVEMEALTAAAVASLALYDMTKAIDKGAVIVDTRLLRKWGGKSGDFVAP
ncbi:MAG: cyclic pyranopterin monophosphate synthase MoaC [Deltaproteobacteria bacterium]|nr:cyclic pyranopterin monophosphate synthase MoaC [Deltaproteobacteria bacterium]